MLNKNELIETTPAIKEIIVIDEVVVKCEGNKLCFPEAVFEMVEQCKLCGKWI
jgi:hypothetical protein